MLFNSLHFIVFFMLVTALYYSVGARFRWVLLLVASAYFYASFIPAYLLILGFIILVDYLAGICIERAAGKLRLWILVLSIVVNVGFLAFFKYFDFVNNNLAVLLKWFGEKDTMPPFKAIFPGLLLPIGLSFHTFQSMSYTIEVYRGRQKAEYHIGIYALYVLFYPQLVAGPIERPQNVLWQFREKMDFDTDNLRTGLWMMIWGMFKKVVIADRLALVTDHAFGDIAHQNGSTLLIAICFYSIQIYCDFSGYSDIAVGAARTMGFRLMTNFRAPYFATSIAQFWQRWHISLSTWFRDYVYIPLGGNRRGEVHTCMNLMLVFLLSGLWHGADWKFVVWGGLHGAYLILARVIRAEKVFRQTGMVSRWIHTVWTFLLVAFAWIFFRAESLSDGLEVIRILGSPSAYALPEPGISLVECGFCILLIFILLYKERYLAYYIPTRMWYWPALGAGVTLCYFFGVFGSNQFIYFQF